MMKTRRTTTAARSSQGSAAAVFKRARLARIFALVACVSLPGPTIADRVDGPERRDPRREADTLREHDERTPPDRAYLPRSRYTWPYASGPAYGRPTSRGPREAGWLIHPVGSFRLDAGPLPLPPELTTTNRLDRLPHQYFLVQLDPATVSGPRWEALYTTLRESGGEVLRHLPVAVVLTRLTRAGHARLLAAGDVLALVPYHPGFKLDPAIGRAPLLDAEKAVSDSYALDISLHRSESSDEVASRIVDLGGTVQRVRGHRIQAELPASGLGELAGLEAVYRVHERLPIVPFDQRITNAVQTGGIRGNANPFHAAGIRGAGQILMILDNGLQLDAGDLADTASSPGSAGASHRKVRFYGTTAPFGGGGDDRGCDAPEQGGFTHGHLVAAVAVGNPDHASLTFRALDSAGDTWDLTGVAPDARVAMYDAQITPPTGACQDTLLGVLDIGTLYDPAPDGAGSLDDAYQSYGARTFNFSWGSNTNSYTADSEDVDLFLKDHADAMVFIAVGNQGSDLNQDGIPDPGNISQPATAKNAVAVGSHGGPDDLGDPSNINERSSHSAVGPAGAAGRLAPLLMAPGQERGATGIPIAFSCRTRTNDSAGAVICDTVSGKAGTSYAAAAASGAGLLVRDYFAQGFHPDGTSGNPGNAADIVPDVSGALVKSVLIASADFLGNAFSGTLVPGDNLRVRHRANHEQGYGRIQLDNALPLQNWADSPTGLLVVDGGILGGANDFAGGGPTGLTGSIDATTPTTQSGTFDVCDDSQELRVALSWIDAPGDALINDLNLEIVAPDGTLYLGNHFTDDDNGDGVVDPLNENCPTAFDDGTPSDNGVDRSQWSLPACTRPGDGGGASLPPRDATNPTEGIFLSPNPEGRLDAAARPILRGGTCDDAAAAACGYDAQCDGVACVGGRSQVQAGTWTVRVSTSGPGANAAQAYALVIAGGVCRGSSVTLDRPSYHCSDRAELSIVERSEASDPAGGLNAAVVAGRTTVDVLDGSGAVVDTEPGDALGFLQTDPNALRFVATDITITDATLYDPGNGVLDVRDGDTIRLRYADESVGGVGGDPDKVRVATARIGCRLEVSDAIRISQFGTNAPFFIAGGCERNARDLFEFGFPDRYMDAGERLAYRFAWAAAHPLRAAEVELTCVRVDDDSPADCKPGSTLCADPERRNNPPCTELAILNPRQSVGAVDAATATSSNFQIQVAAGLSGTPEVELLLRITDAAQGGAARALLVNRHRLNVDEVSVHYSTDFPQGGTLHWDRNNDGLIENPVTTGAAGFPTSSNTDYVFETRNYSDLTQGTDAAGNPVTVNDGLQSPWNFDTSDGGFTSGIVAGTDDALIPAKIALWGEDKNFNNRLDGQCWSARAQACDRFPLDPINCGFCDDDGTACANDADCAGVCDFGCLNLEDRDPENLPIALLDQNWSTRGGCGWQTKAPATCSGDASIGCYNDADCGESGICSGPAPATGGIWHTGRIGSTTGTACAVAGDAPGQCQLYETIGGTSGQLTWFELLVTPEVAKVNQTLDANGRPLASAEITAWAWNHAVDLPDNNATYTIEFDNDLDSLEPVDLKSDFSVLNTLTGPYGAINGGGNPYLTRGWGLFAPIDPATGQSVNGTAGNNRVGKNACFFEGDVIPPANQRSLYTGLPPDDDTYEGYCPSGQGLSGMDPHLNYCTTVCSARPDVTCAADDDCDAGTCNGFYCSNDRTVACRNECDGGVRQGFACTTDSACWRCAGGSRDLLTCTTDVNCPDGTCVNDIVCGPSAGAGCDLGTCGDTACNGACVDGACSNGKPGSCTDDAGCAEACVFASAAIDEFVQPNGPTRGMELNDLNGPDMRFDTLADIAGPAGNRFAGAIGLQLRESNTSLAAVAGYGLGVDDVVLEWREFTLEEDQTECAARCVGGPEAGQPCAAAGVCGPGGICSGGSCATLSLSTSDLAGGNAQVQVTVFDSSPSDNDCDGDGIADGTRDCDGNGVRDVVVTVDALGGTAAGDVERVVLSASPAVVGLYEGTLQISSSFDAPGTLQLPPLSGVLVQTAGQLPRLPGSLRAIYVDLDDGTGRPCQAGLDPEAWGRVETTASVTVVPALISVTRLRVVSDNGDDDGWADPGETVRVAVEVVNHGSLSFDVTGLRLYLVSDDPAVGCITVPTVAVGDLAAGERRFAEQTFEFIVDPGVERAGPLESVTASFKIMAEAHEFQATRLPQGVTLDLDLDAVSGGAPTTYFEGFEGGFGTFTTMHLDESLNPPDSDLGNLSAGVRNADGWRCQYSDPDWRESTSYGTSFGQRCYPNPIGAPDAFYFNVVTDRAFSGMQSLAYNIFLDASRGYTTPTAQLEAVRTIDPVNLNWAHVCSISRTQSCSDALDCPAGEACEPAQPTLTFKHQISLVDHRSINAQTGRGPDRAIVSVQLADMDGNGVGPWSKLYPFVNVYDTQANSNFFYCSFDPADDGNTEEDFFDPTDPLRRLGPSSTCAPEFSFVHQGDTDEAFLSGNVGDASSGLGLEGALGTGTWVEPVFDLARYRGRRIRMRFLESGWSIGSTPNWEAAFGFNPDPTDDGWFVDDVRITDAVADPPATLLVDTKDPSLLPACDARRCGESGGVQAALQARRPAGSALPGHSLELDASGSTVDVCKQGALQYRYWIEVDGDDRFNPRADRLLRDWTFSELALDTPQGSTSYGVAARCSTDPGCTDTGVVTAGVDCPSSGSLTATGEHPFLHRTPPERRTVLLDATPAGGDKQVRVLWTTEATLDVVRGDLNQLRSDGAFGTSEVCAADNFNQGTEWTDGTPTPQDGDGLFWLLRSAAACNAPTAGGSFGGIGEATGRDAAIQACPD